MTDAYYLAYSVATFGFLVLLAALRQGAIPKLTEMRTGSSRQVLSRGCSELLSATLVTTTVISVVATAVMLLAVPLAAAGSEHLVSLTRQYLLELAPYAVSGAMQGALASILAVTGMFAIPALLVGCEPVLKVVLVLVVPGLGAQALVFLGSLGGNLIAVIILWQLAPPPRNHAGFRRLPAEPSRAKRPRAGRAAGNRSNGPSGQSAH